jgi:hypothetical protein
LHDSFTFQAQADGQVRLALVGVREADEAVIVVTKQAATATRLFRRAARAHVDGVIQRRWPIGWK